MSEKQNDRTCEVHFCAAEPCVLHRVDEEAKYLTDTRPHSAPRCEKCDESMVKKVTSMSADEIAVRYKYECPECGALAVVEEYPAQRQLAEFGGGDGDE